jgi:MoxR-like ATPase
VAAAPGSQTASAQALPAEPLGAEEFREIARAIEQEVAGTIVGQTEAVRGALVCLIAGGHALLEGVPGLGKTTMARALASALRLPHSRIQFTPDLMPADITGTTILMDDGGSRVPQLRFQPGPIFAGLVLADEINRASPRTQSALLEAMQEGTVTIANVTHPLPRPFCVLATQNPVEMQGTYPLPEAQLDRFLLKLRFEYPSAAELNEIVAHTSGREQPPVREIADSETLLRMNALARSVPAASHVIDYASRVVIALQPTSATASPRVREYVRLGPSPRGALALSLGGRVTALMAGRYNLSFEDVRGIAQLALRHRLVLSFDAERRDITAEQLITETLEQVPEEAG